MSDHEILALFKDQNTREKAFRILMDTYQEKLYWVIRRMLNSHEDTDDVLQLTFIKAWKGLHGFRGESKLFTWLYRIATNESLSHISRSKKHSLLVPIHTEQDSDHLSVAKELKADSYFDGDNAQLKLKSAIDSLPPKQKLVFTMRYYDEMTYEEMSEAVGTSTGALKASYHHAVRKIEDYLRNE